MKNMMVIEVTEKKNESQTTYAPESTELQDRIIAAVSNAKTSAKGTDYFVVTGDTEE